MQAAGNTGPAPPAGNTEPPDIRRAANWRGWAEGLREAQSKQAPILCLAEAHWTNSAQRLAHVMAHDGTSGETLEQFIPIYVEPLNHPDVVATLRYAAVAQTGSDGPPLLGLLTHEGQPFLHYCTMFPEGGDDYPSLSSLLASVAELYESQREHVIAEARESSGNRLTEPTSQADALGATWTALEKRLDDRFGGVREKPKHPNPPLLELLMHHAEAGEAAARAHLYRTLTGMYAGGILDQLTERFHRCSRDDRWIIPHFEMTCTGNAALAAIYAKAAQLFDNPDFRRVATSAARFALSCLQEGICAVAADTRYYTWTGQELQDSLDPALVQALGLHFKITPHPSRHVLYRARELEAMAEASFESVETLRRRLAAGKSQLALHRARRPSPALVKLMAPSWAAETIQELYVASRAGVDIDPSTLREELGKLIDSPYDPLLGYSRAGGHYLEDQVAVALCCISAYDITRERELLKLASRLARVVLEQYCNPASGELFDRPTTSPTRQASSASIDALIPAPISTTVRALRLVAAHDGDAEWDKLAQAVFDRYQRAAALAGPRAASLSLARLAESR